MKVNADALPFYLIEVVPKTEVLEQPQLILKKKIVIIGIIGDCYVGRTGKKRP
jgi:hypothetical protein